LFVIPDTWYSLIIFENGKPDLNAIIILSDILYWYRAKEVRDEKTGKITGYKKRFSGDKLQRSYQDLADKFGLSKKQVRDAVKRLEAAGVIETELRNIEVKGTVLTNVMFITPNPGMIERITFEEILTAEDEPKEGVPIEGDTYIEVDTSLHQSIDLPTQKDTPPYTEGGTYTETTTETSTKTTTNMYMSPSDERIDSSADRKSNPSQEVIDYFNAVWEDIHPRGCTLTPKRKKQILARLKTFGLDTIKRAIDNLYKSPWHVGDNPSGWKATIDFLIRSDEQVDTWANNPPMSLNNARTSQSNAEQGEDPYAEIYL
jgi:DNA-binding Lrp family transcriptional regulator